MNNCSEVCRNILNMKEDSKLLNLTFMGACIVRIFQYVSRRMQRYTVYYMWNLLYMFQVVPPPIIRSAYNCIYIICYLSDRYCYLPLPWKSWNRFQLFLVEELERSSNSSTIEGFHKKEEI